MTKAKASGNKLTWTKNYQLFDLDKQNRPVDLSGSKRKQLVEFMKQVGFLPIPILCKRVNQRLVVVDGQHRLAAARELGLAVCYVVLDDEVEIDIPKLQVCAKAWTAYDYARSYALSGLKDYQVLLDFIAEFDLPISAGMSLLVNNVAYNNVHNKFRAGKFVVSDEKGARRVAMLYMQIVRFSSQVKTRFMLSALQACCAVPEFEDKRLLQCVSRRPDMLVKLGSREAFLHRLEEIYNFGRKPFPLKFYAEAAISSRNIANRGKLDSKE